ncbi:hypothetical protein CLF_108790 [Clonorchis sinensis]|uniref:Uncharacterized protein n=1 Tax=Clonorchis sinensis TaxID=79923 RepID=G7YIJ4_CLOSI|nr:hypothetical protein CLF_108790 [Clonorchis sinensis]
MECTGGENTRTSNFSTKSSTAFKNKTCAAMTAIKNMNPAPTVGPDPALRNDDSVRLAPGLDATSASHMAPTSSNIAKPMSKPRCPVYLAIIDIRTLKQAGKQAALTPTADLLGIDVRCLRNKNSRCKHND